MFKEEYLSNLKQELISLEREGMYKHEYEITSPQDANVTAIVNGKPREVLNLCANNYLGLANHERLVKAAQNALDQYAFGTASVRFICGTSQLNLKLEEAIANFLGYEAAITFPSCFQANNGIFQALLTSEDAIVTANLNHASLIDGIRLCKAKRFFYQFDNMEDLERSLQQAQAGGAKNIMIVTDGVFSMDGDIANLPDIVSLAKQYSCITMVDDCHATGFMGKSGKGTHEHHNLKPGAIDIISSTTGKALGGASGGFVVSNKTVIEKLRNAHRGYLFSNNFIPSVAAATLEVFKILEESASQLVATLQQNTALFREQMQKLGFTIRPGIHPVVPVMLGDAKPAANLAKILMEEHNIYVTPFSYPVVPKGAARIRVQISAQHTQDQLSQAIEAFRLAGQKLGLIASS